MLISLQPTLRSSEYQSGQPFLLTERGDDGKLKWALSGVGRAPARITFTRQVKRTAVDASYGFQTVGLR